MTTTHKPDPNSSLIAALHDEQRALRESLDRLSAMASDAMSDEPHELTRKIRNAIEYIGCLRRLLAGRSLREVHDAFGAPGDFGYDHPVGAALSSIYAAPPHRTIFDELRAERERAQKKHAGSNMEEMPPDDIRRLPILMEEIGEVANEFNEARHRAGPVDRAKLRKELIQVASAAAAWADALGEEGSSHG